MLSDFFCGCHKNYLDPRTEAASPESIYSLCIEAVDVRRECHECTCEPTLESPDQPQIVTSTSAPMRVSWMRGRSEGISRVALSSAPGKRVDGRDGLHYERSLETDLTDLRDNIGITTVVCLLNAIELAAIGVELSDYKDLGEVLGLNVLFHPIREMDGIPVADALMVCRELHEHIKAANENRVLIHCRGGLGRAGTLAACIVLYLREAETAEEAIRIVRECRSQRAIESTEQVRTIVEFCHKVVGTPAADAVSPEKPPPQPSKCMTPLAFPAFKTN